MTEKNFSEKKKRKSIKKRYIKPNISHSNTIESLAGSCTSVSLLCTPSHT